MKNTLNDLDRRPAVSDVDELELRYREVQHLRKLVSQLESPLVGAVPPALLDTSDHRSLH